MPASPRRLAPVLALTTADPDGHVVIFTAARPPELTDPAFSARMRQWSGEHT